MAQTANFQALRSAVIAASKTDHWNTAVLEWDVTYVEEHPSSEGECVCGQTNLLWMFMISNSKDGAELFPIGSSCVNHFERTDLNRQIVVFSKLMRIRAAAQHQKQVTLATDFFSRAVLDYLLRSGAFTPDRYNLGDGQGDHDFLRKMFGVRGKSTISSARQWKIRKLLDLKVVPFILADDRLG